VNAFPHDVQRTVANVSSGWTFFKKFLLGGYGARLKPTGLPHIYKRPRGGLYSPVWTEFLS
jgi:hypothetical protein